MKKIFASLSFMLAVGLTTVFAGEKKEVNSKIEASFKKEFAGVDFVKWDKIENYQRAAFLFNGHPVIAFFDEDGELLGSARNIFYDQLPMTVVKSLDKSFAGAEFFGIYEISNVEGTSYGMTLEAQNKRYHVKVNTDGYFLNVIKIK